ncbi:GNAT family N-acetyltransferase [Streptomyces sp. NPDC002209]|uniref:GNAT family N-acetyltransferase n=1 Tax=Streptomyces sp. NPDC002209 TaxID=3364638 RepID=UPI00368B2979
MDQLPTERLVLVPLDPARARGLLSGVPGAGCRWGPGYPDDGDRAGARRYLRVLAETGDPAPFGAYEIRRRGDGLTIGGAGFHGPADAAGVVTVGYGLIPAARGRGYAAEALRALLGHARAHGASGAAGDADRENAASHRVMAAAGMRLVGEDERLRYYAVSWAGAPEAASS